MTKDDAINHVIRLMERQRADNMPIKSNREVANEIGVPKETVRNWERGLAVMPAVYWAPVCEMLYLCPWELLTGSCRRSLMPDLPAHLRKVNPRARRA